MAEGGADATLEPAVQGEGDETSSDEKEITHHPSCVFCRIVSKEHPTQIMYEDSDYICFWDHRPAATHHYLVIPKDHIRDPKVLRAEHIPLVERMVEIGKQVLTEQGGDMREARIGFHWPPLILVRHLHLHVIAPESAMGWFNRTIMFRVNSFGFVTYTWMLDHLKSLQ